VDARRAFELKVGMTTKKHPELRRSTRVAADVAVALDVLMEVQGEDFQYLGKTITVNLHGALVTTAAPLKVGDQVKINVHLTGKSALATVVFASDDPREFGIGLRTPENIWGVALPPKDWNMRGSDADRSK
jgi:hypothetical protein